MDVVVATVVDSLVSEDVLVEVDDVDIFLDVKVEAVDVTDRDVLVDEELFLEDVAVVVVDIFCDDTVVEPTI